jgi:hypothetical protein
VRRCKCGCGVSLDGRRREARYASAACRTRDWKRRHGITPGDVQETSRNARPRPVEMRVSLRKAERLASTRPAAIAAAVREVLHEALTDRQRAALDQ